VHAHDVGAAGARHPDVAERVAAGNGLVPTDSVLTTLFVAGSIRESVFEPRFGTKTVPSSAIAAFSGFLPTLIVATTFSVRGLIRETVFERWFETQIAVSEAATERGVLPTRMALTRFVRGSIRKILRPISDPTQTAPAPGGYFDACIESVLEGEEGDTPSHVYLGVVRDFLRHGYDVSDVSMEAIATTSASA
jgi:hypothetical protein